MNSPLNIQNFLDSNTISTSLMRGKSLHRLGSIKGFAIHAENQQIELKVQGTQLYSITVKHDFENLQGSCNCPYNHGGACKHIVAALLYLEQYLINNPNALTSVRVTKKVASALRKTDTSKWMSIGKIQNTHEVYLNQYATLQTRNSLRNAYVVRKKLYFDEISNDTVKFSLGDSWDEEDITFKHDKGTLYTKCSCNTLTMGLCVHQAVTLNKIFKTYTNSFFDCLQPDFQNKLKVETFKTYGIPESEEFDEYFKFEIDSDGFEVVPTKKGKGLVKVNLASNENSLNTLDFLETKQLSLNTFIPKETSENYKIGFVLFFPDPDREVKRYYDELDNIELVPIYGKINNARNALVSSIAPLNQLKNSHQVEISSTEEELILLAQSTTQLSLNEFTERNSIDDEEKEIETLKYYFGIFSKSLIGLSQCDFVYTTKTSYIERRKLKAVSVSSELAEISYKLSSDTTFIKLTANLELGHDTVSVGSPKLKFHGSLFVEFEKTLYLVASIRTAIMLEMARKNPVLKTPKGEALSFFDKYVLPVSKHFPVKITSNLFKVKKVKQPIIKKQLYISELNKFVLFQPVALYEDGARINILKKQTSLAREGNVISTIERDLFAEDEYNQLLKSLHKKFKEQFPEEYYHLNIDEMISNYWFYEAFEKLRDQDVEIFGLNELKKFPYSPHKANVSINIASGQDWFDVELTVQFGDYQISLNDIKKAVLRKDKFIKLSDGSLGILPQEWIEKFERYFRHGQIKKGELKISSLKFSLIDELFEEQDYGNLIFEIAEKKRTLKSFEEIKKVKIPKEIKGKLRDYQVFGYNWMNFLDEFKWGGILADDMGLGKTLQVITFLQKQVKKSKKTNLIVVPTTLLFNWKNELEKFAPTLITHFHYGNAREKEPENFKGLDLIITTYGLIINDIELLRKMKFNYVILDESQAIKNPSSKRFKAVSLLNAQNKIAMTGTPIENNTFDLFAQMDFVNPGFLGSQAQFKENYSTPIDKNQSAERAAELQKIINPFVLRRTKEQVAKELPEKTEDYIYCTMEPEQRKVYDAFRNKYRNFLMNKIESDGLGKSKIYVLEGLTKLRQICDSPQLLPGEEDFGTSSVKIKELIRHIKEKTANHKILVFSQFVKMLKLIEAQIKIEGIEYEYLDGKSSKKAREKSVKNFQENTNIRTFLISLKAGGTGINLTEADYVYIVDPWWNPAVENQAIDRCHRIGQSKKVIAYRMICKDTIEEKIIDHQEKKKRIATDIISTDEGFVKKLTASDINSLFD